MKRVTLAIALICSFSVWSESQVPSTSHIFPYFVDGFFENGSWIGSGFTVTNMNLQSVTCTFRLSSEELNNRLVGGSKTFTLPTLGSSAIRWTEGHNPIASGYGTLTCGHPVIASVGYVQFSGQNVVLGAANLFSSPSGDRGQFNIDPRFPLGFVIVNDTDSAAEYQVNVISSSGTSSVTTTVSVPARSNIAQFAHELMAIPSDAVLLKVTGLPGFSFSMIGLTFHGDVFQMQPAIMF